jgi:hypothetical protein
MLGNTFLYIDSRYVYSVQLLWWAQGIAGEYYMIWQNPSKDCLDEGFEKASH